MERVKVMGFEFEHPDDVSTQFLVHEKGIGPTTMEDEMLKDTERKEALGFV